MANEEHFSILKQGAQVWNEWRKQNPTVEPDLTGADLSRINLWYMSPSAKGYQGRIIITGANLRGADLSGANLSQANFNHTDLSYSYLNAADLREAAIWDTNFTHAKVNGADFSLAVTGGVLFCDIDISTVKGLVSIRHSGPSYISIDTIYKSGGNIPEIFLRGCGVPDESITYVRSLVAAREPIQFYSCFISYSSEDQAFAERLYADLQNKGVRCWFAPEDMKIGDRFRIRIDESIRVYDKLLLVLSENSVSSQWVEKEVETAMEQEREQNKTMLFPVRIDDRINEMRTGWPADVRRTRHIGDFTRWKDHDLYQRAFDRLLRALKA